MATHILTQLDGICKEINILAQAALRAAHEVTLQCVAGHCYYHRSVSPLFFSPSFALTHFCIIPFNILKSQQ